MLFKKEDLTKKPGDIVSICWVLNHIVDTLRCPQTWLKIPKEKDVFGGRNSSMSNVQCHVESLAGIE